MQSTDQSENAAKSFHKVVLRLSGVATPLEAGRDGEGFVFDPMGNWRPLRDDGLYDVEDQCVRLHDELAARIFGSLSRYHSLLPTTPPFLAEAGLNSESPVGRDQFEKLLLEGASSVPELNRFLYLYDCRGLVTSIQECSKEVSQLAGEFYRILNLEPFFIPAMAFEDGTRWSSSPSVTYLNATLGFLFIRLHSQLDYFAKLACEIEKLKMSFETYPRLASSNFLFGDRRKLNVNGSPGSLFEQCDEVAEVELVRNVLIHDGLLDDMPKAYEVTRGGVVVERFVLVPDRSGGQFERFKNRRRFYGREDKINLRLADLVRQFHARATKTLQALRSSLSSSGS